MASFTDNQGETWQVNVTIATMKSFRDRLGINLLTLFDKGDESEIEAIFDDVILVVDLLYLCCEQQCKERGLTDTQFGERFSEQIVIKAAQAFVEGLHDFFPDGKAKLILAMAIARFGKLEKINAENTQKLRQSPKLNDELDRVIFGSPSTELQESSESSQTS